ncbi:Tryptophan--tRNA ligase, mitochondrial [Friedmanniomyces endolithicus]|uniref:Tryptophan--tRNA ligase, mitochondrial n=1 Tax=Friedmanniomyces endolithicus TaxID=329885 RepID=A0AAN6K3W3_9PEZI|nr:Tryptophan--tRNA ligase, mitochondrial [Friedmanniomyces endolithicus]KAK0959669.1 Tryptophan--tRNA ligase, mitochondrial [Friedmanniomyces endolithicus]KAK0960599.1 Tryptophan--tRNA ligase, mitochondrial [Friedmanniomyces endolithicus]KAK1022087.1 Tryptophan--tRNA ligase, mitochondrial [Friedmanniomyces endolithicus]
MLPRIRNIGRDTLRQWSCATSIPGSHRLTLQTVWSRDQSTKATTPAKTIFSGIQPTGVPHLGNYLGALRQWATLQNDAATNMTLVYSLVDLHAITVQQDSNQLQQWKKESLAMLLAIGLDPNKSTIFHQSDVPAHAELMWILSCQASTGYLSRMTQWKDKTANEKDGNKKLKLGLLSYPVLQAADILVHRATHVPVGHDQAQHLEFARELANGFNHTFGGDVLIPPETLISPARRVMSLKDPMAKMSKSHTNPNSRILLTDSEETIRTKIKAAVTDSMDSITYDPEGRPGVSNLIDILYHSDAHPAYPSQDELAKDLAGLSMRALKDRVAETVETTIKHIRASYAHFLNDNDYLDKVAAQGAEKAAKSATTTMKAVKSAVGLI